MEGICYIVGAGPVEELSLKPSEKDFVIAADAGYLHMARLSAAPDLVVGDFDSLGQKPNHPNIVEHPKEKDQTDTMLAIDEGLRRHYKRFVILGGLGGRLDHTYANIQTLIFLAQNNARGYLLGSGTAVTVIKNGSIAFDDETKGTVSVFCCCEPAKGVTLKGLKYPLDNAVLVESNPLGVSNEFTGEISEITVSDGSLVVMWEEKAADFIDKLRQARYRSLLYLPQRIDGVSMTELKGAIFDLDGTLFDSNSMWDSIAEEYLKSQGITPYGDVREAVSAMSIQQVCAYFCSEYKLALSREEIVGGINAMVEDFYYNRVQLKDGVEETLERMKSRGIKMCVATATDRYLVEAGLRQTGISDYFSRIFTCTEVGAGKDAPDIYLQALDFLGTGIKETIVFEDALYAVRTAKTAGFTVAALYDESICHQQDEIRPLADYYLLSFADWRALNK